MSMIKLTYNFTFKDYRNDEEIKNVSSILLPLPKYAFQLNRKNILARFPLKIIPAHEV